MVAPRCRPKASGKLLAAESVVCLALEIPQKGKIMRNGRATARRSVTVAAVITDSEDFQVPSPISYVDIPADTSAR